MKARDWFRSGRWADIILVALIIGTIAVAYDAIQDPFW